MQRSWIPLCGLAVAITSFCAMSNSACSGGSRPQRTHIPTKSPQQAATPDPGHGSGEPDPGASDAQGRPSLPGNSNSQNEPPLPGGTGSGSQPNSGQISGGTGTSAGSSAGTGSRTTTGSGSPAGTGTGSGSPAGTGSGTGQSAEGTGSGDGDGDGANHGTATAANGNEASTTGSGTGSGNDPSDLTPEELAYRDASCRLYTAAYGTCRSDCPDAICTALNTPYVSDDPQNDHRVNRVYQNLVTTSQDRNCTDPRWLSACYNTDGDPNEGLYPYCTGVCDDYKIKQEHSSSPP